VSIFIEVLILSSCFFVGGSSGLFTVVISSVKVRQEFGGRLTGGG
jgi:hypothetical protein